MRCEATFERGIVPHLQPCSCLRQDGLHQGQRHDVLHKGQALPCKQSYSKTQDDSGCLCGMRRGLEDMCVQQQQEITGKER